MKLFKVIILIFLTGNVLSQDISDLNSGDFFNSQALYQGGDTLFRLLLQENLSYPISFPYKTGLMIGGIVVDYEGGINDVFILHSIGREFDNVFRKVIRKTKGKWLPQNDSTKLYYKLIPISFSLLEKGKNFETPEQNFPDFIQTPIYLFGYDEDPSRLNNVDLYAQANGLYNNKRYSDCLELINNLIRFDPFNDSLVLMSLVCNSNLGNDNKACFDYWYLTRFLGKKSYVQQLQLEGLCFKNE